MGGTEGTLRPVLVVKRTGHEDMVLPPLYKQRRIRTPGPVRPDEVQGVKSPGRTSHLDRICGDKDSDDEIYVIPVLSAYDLEHSRGVVSTDNNFFIAAAALQEHHDCLSGLHCEFGDFNILEMGDELFFSGEDRIFARQCLPHLFIRKVTAELCGRKGGAALCTGNAAVFNSASLPSISVEHYIQRLWIQLNLEQSVLVVACIYLHRVQKLKSISVTKLTAHRLVLAVIILACKYLQDDIFSDRHMAQAGGVSLKELWRLEGSLVGILEWKLFVSPSEYFSMLHKLK